jgi:hypothetical protein
MKKFLLASFAFSAAFAVNAQTDSDHICEEGFIMEFNQRERIASIDTTGTTDNTRMGIDWWGCGITGTPGEGDCSATDANYQTTAADGKLSVSVTKSAAGGGTWTPMGFSTLDGAKTKSVNIDATKSIDISYTNSSNVGMEVYFGFIFADGNITLDAQGVSIGGPIAAGATIESSIDLNIPVIGNDWCISEDECASKPNNNGGGNPVGGPACSVQCTWESSVDFTQFEGAEITITGENTSTGYADLTGEVLEFNYIKAGTYENCYGVSTEEVVTAGLKIFPNPASDVLNVKFDAASATTIQLVDITGKVIDTQLTQAGTVTTSFATTQINSGVYFVNFKNAVGSTTQKVVVK